MNRPVLLFQSLLALFLPLTASLGPAAPVAQPLIVISNGPPIQMLIPGFAVRELPIQLKNINNLVYAPDGRLFALGYDGNVYQLHDEDGDGLEEAATLFHDNRNNEIPESIGMTWGPAQLGDGNAHGLYIPSRGRMFFLRDRGDGASELHTATSGWDPPSIKGGSSLDAVGVAVDPEGGIFFALSVDAWSSPYRVNKATGKSDYHLYSERGTILKLSPDWKRRDIICTGMRFPVSLAFNAAGDLFCSEQEGATWLANGNPFDELLHIQKGRHYGFPPRHPLHLPGVIDEPSVFDYRPQHQSTCGLHFNEPLANSDRIFGPAWWRGDALVAGESRGKIWRTKLVKTPFGYVAQNSLLACLTLLTIDAVPTPRGHLLVACHTGAPDWGTGPKGPGRLFQISYEDRSAPQPLLAYATSPTETRIDFDRPLNPTELRNLTSRSEITMGEHVSAGDRFESMKPGYRVVQDQSRVGRYQLPVLSAGITPDRRSIVLLTEPRVQSLNYAISLRETVPANDRQGQGQRRDIDLLTDLNGVEAEWRGERVWIPHLDLAVTRELTQASKLHQSFIANSEAGGLTLRTQLDLDLMLRTAIQPGSELDFDYPTEVVTLVLKADAGLDLKTNGETRRVGDQEAHVTFRPARNHWLQLEVRLKGNADLTAYWHTAEDHRPRAFPLRRFKLPWARPADETPASPERNLPELEDGNWAEGRKLFFSEQLACGKCHKTGEEGGRIGPELSNLIHRDYASVMKDILQPSAAINPDHIAYNMTLKDGEEASGVVLDESEGQLILGQATGENLILPKTQVSRRDASTVSLMPEGLLDPLSAEQKRDLMTFLLTPKPR